MNTIDLPVTYFAQTPDACVDLYSSYNSAALRSRQFEWTTCGYYHYELETDLVDGTLDADGLPIPTSGVNLPNRGITIDNFSRWFHELPDLSTRSESTLALTETTSGFAASPTLPQGLFTMTTEFIVKGTGTLSLTADDDTWVFINNRLALDLGGIHNPITAHLDFRDSGEVYSGLTDLAYSGVKIDDSAVVKIFHANRDSGTPATFNFATSGGLAITTTANHQDGYAEPLGETLSVLPRYQTIVNGIIAESAIVVVAALLVVAIFWARKYSRLSRNRG